MVCRSQTRQKSGDHWVVIFSWYLTWFCVKRRRKDGFNGRFIANGKGLYGTKCKVQLAQVRSVPIDTSGAHTMQHSKLEQLQRTTERQYLFGADWRRGDMENKRRQTIDGGESDGLLLLSWFLKDLSTVRMQLIAHWPSLLFYFIFFFLPATL